MVRWKMARLQDHMFSIRNGKVSKGSINWHDHASIEHIIEGVLPAKWKPGNYY